MERDLESDSVALRTVIGEFSNRELRIGTSHFLPGGFPEKLSCALWLPYPGASSLILNPCLFSDVSPVIYYSTHASHPALLLFPKRLRGKAWLVHPETHSLPAAVHGKPLSLIFPGVSRQGMEYLAKPFPDLCAGSIPFTAGQWEGSS